MRIRTLRFLSLVFVLGELTLPTHTTSAQDVVTLSIEYLWDIDQPEEWQALSSNPGGLVWGETGELFIADTRSARILLVDTDGNLIQEIGRSGEGPGEFREPRAIAYDHNSQTLWVADWILSRCSKFVRREGRYEFEDSNRIGIVSNAPAPIFAVDEGGNLWLMNSVRGTGGEFRIRNLGPDGRLIREIAPAQEAPSPWRPNTWNRGSVLALRGNRIAYIWHSQPLVEIWNKDGQLVLDRLLGGPTFDMPSLIKRPNGEVWFPASFSVIAYDRINDVIFVSGREQERRGVLFVGLDTQNLQEVGRYFLPVPENSESFPWIRDLLVEWVGESIRFMGLEGRTLCFVRLSPIEP